MKYSLASLLLEDIEKRSLSLDIKPSAEDAEKAYLLNVYSWFKKAGEVAKEKLGSMGMSYLYEISDPDIRGIIDQAREDAIRKDEEAMAFAEDTSFAEQIVADLGRSSTLSDDQKKALAVCLRFFDQVTPTLVYKWRPNLSAGETWDDFEDKLRQGCKEMQLAAAIGAIDQIEANLRSANADLREAVDESMVEDIRKKLGSQGTGFQLDLTEDPKIKPILTASRKAKRQFKRLIDVEGKSSVFTKPRIPLAVDQRTGSVVYAPCTPPGGTLNFNEGRQSNWMQVLLERATVAGGGPSAAPEAPPATIEEATRQLVARYRPAAGIIEKLRRAGAELRTQTVIDAVKPVSNFGRLQLSFPKEDGGVTTQPITTQGSIQPVRSAAGIIAYFVNRGRKRAVSDDVVRMVGDALGIGIAFPDTPGSRPSVSPRAVMMRLGAASGGLAGLGDEGLAALYFVIAAVAEYSGEASGSSSRDEGPQEFSSFADSSLRALLDYHAMRTALRAERPDDPRLKGGLTFTPGAEPEDPSFVTRLIRRAKGEPVRQRITTFRAFPTLETPYEEEDVIAPPADAESAEMRPQIARAVDTLKRLTAILGAKLPRELRRATSPLRNKAVDGYLPAIEFSEMVADVPKNLRLPEILSLLGYETDALLAQGEADAQSVWLLLCDATGAAKGDTSVSFDASRAYTRLHPDLTGGNLEKAIGGLRSFFMAQFISPLARIIAHAANGYAEMGLLTPGEDGTLKRAIKDLDSAYVKAQVALREIHRESPVTVPSRRVTTKGRLERVSKNLPAVKLNMGPIASHFGKIRLENPLESPGAKAPPVVAQEGAPKDADISTLSIDSPAATDSSTSAPTPDAVPAATAEPTTAATPTAPAPPVSTPPASPPVAPPSAPAAAPTSSPPVTPASAGSATFNVDEAAIGDSQIVSRYVDVTVEAGSLVATMKGTARGGSEQKTARAAGGSRVKVRIASDVAVTGAAEEIRKQLTTEIKGNTWTLSDLADAISGVLNDSENAGEFPEGPPDVTSVTVSASAIASAPSAASPTPTGGDLDFDVEEP